MPSNIWAGFAHFKKGMGYQAEFILILNNKTEMTSGSSVAERIRALSTFGASLYEGNASLTDVLRQTQAQNGWFDREQLWTMLLSFRQQFFDAEKLQAWISGYTPADRMKTVGLVLAGNVPFVGMHDILCVLMSGHRAQIKLSSKDSYFFPWMQAQLQEIYPPLADQLSFTERLQDFDAVIATGSNNSARYFNYYFGKYPHIIRRNRTSVAVLHGDETPEQLEALGKDVFTFYGLGCRNVGKVFVPQGYDQQLLFKYWEPYRQVIDNPKYKHNYDYNRALLLLNNTPYLTNDFYMLVESEQLFSPLSVLYLQSYSDATDLQEKLDPIAADLQCIVSNRPGNTPFGKTQDPGLSDYADHIDTMQFLQSL